LVLFGCFNTSHIDLKRIAEGLGAEICLDLTLLGFLHLIYVFFNMIKAVTECLIIAHLYKLEM